MIKLTSISFLYYSIKFLSQFQIMRLLAAFALALPFVNSQGISSTVSLLSAARLRSNELDLLNCGQGKVANAQKICIEPQYIQGCQLYQSADTCKTCAQGYTLGQGRCSWSSDSETNTNKMAGCLYQRGNSVCINCANGFRRIGTSCRQGIKNCLDYNQDNSCKACKPQFSLIMNQCRHNLLLGCKVETQLHTCKQCYEPFKLQDSVCDIKHCKVLNDYGCTACQCGFYLTADNKCEKMTDGCLRYLRGKCVNCMNHYKLKGKQCAIEGCVQYQGNSCKLCGDKYDKVGNGCTFKNCFDWLDDQCLICENGYHLKDGICEKEDPQMALCQ